ncbi:odorant receptor 82a-like isoform X1 [Pogonomyrmex barbatus]|uniref:Odorant receptor n=1 Tax=Pogonomyrmex barbatus TaxID=144034 RepID=A0A6I9VYF2_9HYME|nr:odorant receptor 82a-like isoform X1 [Pogonomyrmex barbatus]
MKHASTINRGVEIGLRFIGMWPDSAYPTLYWSTYMTVIAVLQYFQYSYVIAHFDISNLQILTDCLGLALATTLAFFKLFVLMWNRKIFYNILAAMDRDWNECVISGYGSTMVIAASQSRRSSVVLIGIHALAGFFFSVGAYVIRTVNNIHTDEPGTIPREFPVKMDVPPEVLETPLFECILVGQFLYELSLASVVGMIDALFAALIIHVGGQIDIMRQVVMEISNSNDLDRSLSVIKDLIRRHRKIITLANDIEDLFSSIALMQLLWNTLIICCSGFMIILALNMKKGTAILIKSTLLYACKTLEVFVFCYAGEFLSSKSKSISDAIYESLWYKLVPSNSRALLFIMLRSQKRLTITAGKIVDLTLEGFMSVMKASVSYMSVLHAMY